ncbi:ABC transporter ATP-binding protein [Aggregicoccus sp. 17bor-14]|uniref:ABC transporter ATP-binding protein n=1 Tax=Myxococcaceae TaxID=31 RepID=UPI00129C2653|nr:MULTISPECIES: ABC transporter ATP-binding protein [Myxococcaceae]MBF5045584.1 ABC transporter ATP-binding protein [Simulacricoccus sp. 17bor-14]MRI91321.1 ABC transporter ATP-binding protein [Aggregicoccus sp. 17bor-14]
MSPPEFAVEVRQVTKRFKRRTVKGGYTTFKTQLVGLLSRKRRERFELQDIQVLKGVDLLVPRGKTVGVIGQNGSGKSTLLKVLTGIYAPSSGTALIHGRVSALLELGAGFHPDFSGRENIFINGVILGLTRAQIREKVDEIIAFSELGDFIDEPVRTYSSGMYMRLAFAVATFVDPDVLIIDEILSVGDEHFTRKSRAKMEEFKERGKTIVLVTHDLGTVESWCDLAAWIDGGRIAEFGDPRRVVAAYRQRVAEREVAADRAAELSPAPTLPDAGPAQAEAPADGAPAGAPAPEAHRWGNGLVRLTDVRLVDAKGEPAPVLDPEASATIELAFATDASVHDAVFGIGLFRADGLQLYGSNTLIEQVPLPKPLPASGSVRIHLERLGLLEGNYLVDVAVHAKDGTAYDYRKGALHFAVRSTQHDVGVVRPAHRWELSAPGLESRARLQAR